MHAANLSGLQKTAILLISLGADLSAVVLQKNFHTDDIEKITQQISMMDRVPKEVQTVVLEEFVQLCQARELFLFGGIDYAKKLLVNVMGSKEAGKLLEKIVITNKNIPFANIRKADPKQLLSYVRDEHPQTIALILTHLPPAKASLILSALSNETQSEVARRIAIIDTVSPEVMQDVARVLESKLLVIDHQEQSIGGVKALVDILNLVDRGTEKVILEELDIVDPELTEVVRKMMFVFEDIVKLPDASIQRVLREVDSKDLAKAMRGTTEEVTERIYRNMSKRASGMMRDEIKYMGPVRLRDVEDAQQRIVQITRRLEEAGEIIIARGGEDAIIT